MKSKDKVSDVERQLLNVLSEKPKTAKQLCSFCDCHGSELRAAVHNLRMNGEKICSGQHGYWIWDGESDDWDHTIADIKSRINSLSELYEAMRG